MGDLCFSGFGFSLTAPLHYADNAFYILTVTRKLVPFTMWKEAMYTGITKSLLIRKTAILFLLRWIWFGLLGFSVLQVQLD